MNSTFFEVRKPTNEKPALLPEQIAKLLRMASPPGLKSENKRNLAQVQQTKESRNRNSTMGMSFDSDSESEDSDYR